MAQESKSGISPALVKLAQEGKLVDGDYRDGRGLLLRVENSRGRWVLRISVAGKRHDYGLGSVRDLGLAAAREKAAEKRKEIRSGKSPAKVKAFTFKEAAENVHKLRKAAWKAGGKHIDQWINTLEAYVVPKFGKKNVGDIEPGDMLDVLTPIWLTIPETARRVRQRCSVVFDWAVTKGYRSAQLANPADVVTSALPRQDDEVEYYPAVQWREVEEEPARSVFSDRWLVLEHAGDEDMPDLRAAALVSKALRAALMSGYKRNGQEADIPPVVSGHAADRAPLAEPHLAIAPLAFLGAQYADRHLKAKGNAEREEEIRALVHLACTNVGLPKPERVAAGKHSAVQGAPPAYPSGRMPPWTRRRLPVSLASRQLTHAVIQFDKPVRGPVILGAGRFAGLGLARALDPEKPA